MNAMKNAGCRLLLFIFLLAPSFVRAAEATLAVTGEVKTPLKLTFAELKAMPVIKLDAKEHDGHAASFEGVPLHEILKRAGAPQGEAMRGGALRLAVLVKAADGYQAVFALAELDPMMADRRVILAFRRDGEELNATSGPFRIIAPDEKRQARWVRQVTELEIVRLGTDKKPQ